MIVEFWYNFNIFRIIKCILIEFGGNGVPIDPHKYCCFSSLIGQYVRFFIIQNWFSLYQNYKSDMVLMWAIYTHFGICNNLLNEIISLLNQSVSIRAKIILLVMLTLPCNLKRYKTPLETAWLDWKVGYCRWKFKVCPYDWT